MESNKINYNMKEQEKKIVNLNNRFDGLEIQMTSFKDDVNMKLDDIFTKLKPRMTRGQEMVIGTLLIGWLVGIMLYTTDTRSNTRNNETRIRSVSCKDAK